VPPELVFDRGLGDFFVVRTGAQALAVTTAWTQERSISSPELEHAPPPAGRGLGDHQDQQVAHGDSDGYVAAGGQPQ